MNILEVMANMVRQGDITLDDALNRAYDEGYEDGFVDRDAETPEPWRA